MKKSLLPYLLCYLFSWPLFAYPNPLSLPWLSPMLIEDANHWPTETLNEMQGLFDCGEQQGKQYCSAPVSYYKTEVESTLWIEGGRVHTVEVLSPFSALSYSELQLNLRKDGFVLAWIQIGEKSIDIIDELKHKALYKVDRDVVMFMNKRAIDTPRKLIWYPKTEYYVAHQSRYVEFFSDGKSVTVRFVRGDHTISD
jgi:hypothetical protein